MENKNLFSSFFSVSYKLVIVDKPIPYDLFVNSSSVEEREKFVRIFPKGDTLTEKDVKRFKSKYHQLYVPEKQRKDYLKSLVNYDGVSEETKALIIKDSAIHYLTNLFNEEQEFSSELLTEAIQGCKESVESMVDLVQDYDVKEIQNLIGTLSFHDFYTYDHSINVSMYCISIFRALKPKATKDELVMAGMGGLLHDLGKINIPTNIINNPGKLTDEEFEVIKTHPQLGVDLLEENQDAQDVKGINFDVIKRIILEHHENFNGTGYPNKIEGEDIHIMARITAIADFFDAITTKRSYHEALPTEEAIAIMKRSVGKKIDPKIFPVFVESINSVLMGKETNKELDDDFDPCQPHQSLPFKLAKATIKQKDFFGKNEKDKPKKSQLKQKDIFSKDEKVEVSKKKKKKAA